MKLISHYSLKEIILEKLKTEIVLIRNKNKYIDLITKTELQKHLDQCPKIYCTYYWYLRKIDLKSI